MFTTNLPVTAESFFDRKDELSRLRAVVNQLTAGKPPWLAILGQRKVGKTSLLLELERLTKRRRLVFVIIDTFEEHPPSFAIFRRYTLRMMEAVFATELGASLESLARSPSEYRRALQHSNQFSRLPPDLKARILDLPEMRIDPTRIRGALDLPERVAEALDLFVLVAWDEFQKLSSLSAGKKGGDPLPLMRAVWQHHKRVGYVISGSERTLLKELLIEEHSPFFHHFSLMELGPLPRSEAIRLLVESAPQDRKITPSLAARAVDTLGSHPFYLQLFGETLTALEPPYDEASLKSALQELIFARMGRLSLFFENEFHKQVGRSTYLAAVLEAICEAPRRLAEMAESIGTTSGATARYLERLGDTITRTDDGRYTLTDPTFALWLSWRKPGGTVLPMTLVGDDAEKAVAKHLARMGFELVYQSRASRGAFDLLAIRGSVQLALQVKRTSLPVKFKKSEWNRMTADAKRLGWLWAVAVVSEPSGNAVEILDPERATIGRQVQIGKNAVVENLLEWVEESSR